MQEFTHQPQPWQNVLPETQSGTCVCQIRALWLAKQIYHVAFEYLLSQLSWARFPGWLLAETCSLWAHSRVQQLLDSPAAWQYLIH